MYTHIAKGSTVGHVLTRRLLRGILGIPGFLIDLVVAIAWLPHYSEYWNDTAQFYFDGVRVGPCQWFIGGIGELLGYPIGSLLGALIGMGCFIPDLLLRGACWLYTDFICENLNNLAIFVGRNAFFRNYFMCEDWPNDDWVGKAWNISAILLGFPLAVLPWAAGKTVEFFLPFLGNRLSNGLGNFGGFVGVWSGWLIAMALSPIDWMTNKLVSKYLGFRVLVSNACAFIYAKSNQEPIVDSRDTCFSNNDQVHSAEFRQKVREYARTSTGEILFGPIALRVVPVPVMAVQQANVVVVPPQVPVVARPEPNAPLPPPPSYEIAAPGGPPARAVR